MEDLTLDGIIAFCTSRGFFAPSCDLYGGLPGVYDYGPLGVELKNHFKRAWWQSIVHERDDVEGLDGAILSHPKLLEYSGHVRAFDDKVRSCRSCNARVRADRLATDACPRCGASTLTDPYGFSTMFRTEIGSIEDQPAPCFLRPATAQHTFANFRRVLDSSGQRLPFGIAQIGKAFRNEVDPTPFLFRMREFEQMELQYFVKPGEDEAWHERWRAERLEWWVAQGIRRDHLSVQDVPRGELAHYSKRTLDIYYRFPGDFLGEIEGIANRTDYDLGCHSKDQHRLQLTARVAAENHESNSFMAVEDGEPNRWTVPFVIEPAAGVDRGVMAVLCEGLCRLPGDHSARRTVLQLKPHLAPFKSAVVAPERASGELLALAKRVKVQLLPLNLGRIVLEASAPPDEVYRKHDTLGTPLCIAVDQETLRGDAAPVLVRDRDTTHQERVRLTDLPAYVRERIQS
jgi:glycyl-tRNA synthetase